MKKYYLIFMFSLIASVGFAQITLVKDIRSGEESTLINSMAADNEKIIFRGNNSTDGAYNVIFVSDGTIDNVREIEINAGGHSMASAFTVYNDEIYLCAYDGTEYGIYRINETTDLGEKVASFDWQKPVVHKGMVYFLDKQNNADNKAIHSWNGTSETTLAHQTNIAGEGKFIPFGDKFLLYGDITDDAPDKGKELLLLDPATGVTRLTDIALDMDATPDSVDAKITEFVTFGDKAYFIAWNEFWETDGTKQNTFKVGVVNDVLNKSSYFGSFFVWNDKIYCKGSMASTESQLYVFDPIEDTFTRLTDYTVDLFNTGVQGPHFLNPSNFIVHDTLLYFTGHDFIAVDYSTPKRLFRTNGNCVEKVNDTIADVDHLTVFNGNIYMGADDGITGKEFFVYYPTPFVDTTISAVESALTVSSLSVYPNPSQGYLNIRGLETKDAVYTLFDLSGRSLEKGMVVNGMIKYYVKPGVYILNLVEENKAKNIKIMVE